MERDEDHSSRRTLARFVDLNSVQIRTSFSISNFISITGTAKPERIYGELTTADYFEVLGVQSYLGHTLISTQANERAGVPIAVLSYYLWQNRFGGDRVLLARPSN